MIFVLIYHAQGTPLDSQTGSTGYFWLKTNLSKKKLTGEFFAVAIFKSFHI